MEGFEYGNARVRAMRSRLLSKGEVIRMAGASSLNELLSLLAKTPYRKSLEVALVHTSDLDGIFEALRRDFVETAGKIRSFFEEKQANLVDLVLSAYDLHNLKAVLRGLSHQSSRAEIDSALLPIGEMSEVVLAELLHATTTREAVDILATISHPFAQPLLVLRVERPGADLFEMEHALDRWRFQKITRLVKEDREGTETILAALNIETDINNLFTILRFIQAPGEQNLVKARIEREGIQALFPGIGSIPLERLNRIFANKNLKSAVASLTDTVYAQALKEGLVAYEQTGHLSEIEKAFRRYQLHWQAWQIAKDPLGIGVVMGYLALKTNEITNLRRIARGIQLKLAPEAVRSELEFTG